MVKINQSRFPQVNKSGNQPLDVKQLSEALTLISKMADQATVNRQEIAKELSAIQKDIGILKQVASRIKLDGIDTESKVKNLSEIQQTFNVHVQDLTDRINKVNLALVEATSDKKLIIVETQLDSVHKSVKEIKDDLEWLIGEVETLRVKIEKAGKGKGQNYFTDIGLTHADRTKLDGIEAGADVTGNHAPKVHAPSHAVGGSDPIAGGSGDMTKAVYDPASKNAQLAALTDIAADTNLSVVAQAAITASHAQNTDTDLDATFEATFEKAASVAADAVAAVAAAGFTLADAKYITFTDPSASHTFSGFVKSHKAHETLAFGNVCFINADEEMALANGAGIATMPACCMCVATAGIAANASGLFLFWGLVHDDTFAFAHTGGKANNVAVSESTAGLATTTLPVGSSAVVQIIGHALATDEAIFSFIPARTIKLVA